MGHAEHFLRRLDRLSDPQVELALRLYNDPGLVGAALGRAKLPEGCERVAIALEDEREGPFVVVTREGRFVTCLGQGMRVGDTTVVTRAQLEAAARDVERMRELLAQVAYVDEHAGLMRKKFEALYEAGPLLGRTQFEDLARWEPLMGPSCLQACIGLGMELLDSAGLLKNVTRVHPKRAARLRRFAQTFYACSHLYVLAGLSPANRSLLVKVLDEHREATWPWVGIRLGVSHMLYRALWSTARVGKPAMSAQKRRLRGELTYLAQADGMLGTAVLGLASDKLRAEARKALRGERRSVEDDPRVRPAGEALDTVLNLCFDHPDVADAMAVATGRQILVQLDAELPAPYRFEDPEEVPEELARAVLLNTSDPVLGAELLTHSFWILPWLARAEAAELYLPDELAAALREPPTAQDAIELLAYQRIERGVRRPRRVEAKPRRNDPCPCGSGTKYKRCCGR